MIVSKKKARAFLDTCAQGQPLSKEQKALRSIIEDAQPTQLPDSSEKSVERYFKTLTILVDSLTRFSLANPVSVVESARRVGLPAFSFDLDCAELPSWVRRARGPSCVPPQAVKKFVRLALMQEIPNAVTIAAEELADRLTELERSWCPNDWYEVTNNINGTKVFKPPSVAPETVYDLRNGDSVNGPRDFLPYAPILASLIKLKAEVATINSDTSVANNRRSKKEYLRKSFAGEMQEIMWRQATYTWDRLNSWHRSNLRYVATTLCWRYARLPAALAEGKPQILEHLTREIFGNADHGAIDRVKRFCGECFYSLPKIAGIPPGGPHYDDYLIPANIMGEFEAEQYAKEVLPGIYDVPVTLGPGEESELLRNRMRRTRKSARNLLGAVRSTAPSSGFDLEKTVEQIGLRFRMFKDANSRRVHCGD